MRPRISIKGSVRPYVRPSVRMSVRPLAFKKNTHRCPIGLVFSSNKFGLFACLPIDLSACVLFYSLSNRLFVSSHIFVCNSFFFSFFLFLLLFLLSTIEKKSWPSSISWSSFFFHFPSHQNSFLNIPPPEKISLIMGVSLESGKIVVQIGVTASLFILQKGNCKLNAVLVSESDPVLS